MQVGHAGSYGPTQGQPPLSSVLTTTDSGFILDCTNTPLPQGVSLSNYKYDPHPANANPANNYVMTSGVNPQGITPYMQTTTYSWMWTPTGRLEDNPAPIRDIQIGYVITGGPMRGIVSGSARVEEAAEVFAQYNSGTGLGAWTASINTADRNQSDPQYPPTGTQYVTLYSSHYPSDIVHVETLTTNAGVPYSKLVFNNTSSAKSNATCTAMKGGRAESQFNLVGIHTTGVSLLP